MNLEVIIPIGLLFLGGIIPLILGVLIWTGRYKTWFIIPHIPVIAPTAFYNGSMVFLAACRRSALPQKPNDVNYLHKQWFGGNKDGPKIQNG